MPVPNEVEQIERATGLRVSVMTIAEAASLLTKTRPNTPRVHWALKLQSGKLCATAGFIYRPFTKLIEEKSNEKTRTSLL